MNFFKAAVLVPAFILFAAHDSFAQEYDSAMTDEEVLALPLPSNEEIEMNMERAYGERSNHGFFAAKCRSGVVPPDRVKRGVVTLTFDDGPSGSTTPTLLNVLAKYKVKAAFFMLGSRAKSSPSLVARIAREGHVVANHSTSHPNFKTLGAEATRKQIEVTDRILAPYMDSGKFFRFPYGNSSCAGNQVLAANGYQPPLGWHIDTLDWKYAKGTVDIATNTFNMVKKQGGGIILMHDIHKRSVNSVEKLIQKLQAAGYTFANIDDASVYPNLNAGNSRAR